MKLSVVVTPEAEDQLLELHRYIATAGSADVAARYTIFSGGRDYQAVLGVAMSE